jgi:hypothetical protein
MGILLEDVQHKLALILEWQPLVFETHRDVQIMKRDIAELKQKNRLVKLTLSEHSKQLNNHEGRITFLEKPAN